MKKHGFALTCARTDSGSIQAAASSCGCLKHHGCQDEQEGRGHRRRSCREEAPESRKQSERYRRRCAFSRHDIASLTSDASDAVDGAHCRCVQRAFADCRCGVAYVCRSSSLPVCAVELLRAGAKVDTKAEDGQSALMVAALQGHSPIVDELLRHTKNIDATDVVRCR